MLLIFFFEVQKLYRKNGGPHNLQCIPFLNKSNNKITELRTILQRESQNS